MKIYNSIVRYIKTYEEIKHVQLTELLTEMWTLIYVTVMVTYLHLLGMRDGQRKGNQINPTVFSLSREFYNEGGENFKLKEHTSKYILILEQKKTPAPGGGLIFEETDTLVLTLCDL